MNPIIGIFIETELWPNTLHTCYKKNIPICLINARLSEKSLRGYQRIQTIARRMLNEIHHIAAVSEMDAKRFLMLNAPKERLTVTGNMKFDLTIPDTVIQEGLHLRRKLGEKSFIWIAASTHPGEDEIILAAHQKLISEHPSACLILVPRHKERFDAVFSLCAKTFTVKRRSEHSIDPSSPPHVFLGDTMGELLILYSASHVAFVGGSLIPHGGHNFIEPAALKKPLLSGPHVFNFADVSHRLITNHALQFVNNAEDLFCALNNFAKDINKINETGNRAYIVANENRGALQKQLEICYGAIYCAR